MTLFDLDGTAPRPADVGPRGGDMDAAADSRLRRSLMAVLWEDACMFDGSPAEPWPAAEADQIIELTLAWSTYGAIDHDPDLAALREEQLRDAGLAWARAHTSPPVMLERLSHLTGVVLRADLAGQLFAEKAVSRITAAAAADALEVLEDRALHDHLTGVGNRRAMHEFFDRELARARRRELSLPIVALDLNGLKVINDRQGHPAGDTAIRSLVTGLRQVLRQEDAIFRVGGDEFIVVLPDTTADAVAPIMARVAAVGAPDFSWGTACFPDDGEDAAQLLRHADQDLYARRPKHRRPGTRGISRPATFTLLTRPLAVATGLLVLTAAIVGLLVRHDARPQSDAAAGRQLGTSGGVAPPARSTPTTVPGGHVSTGSAGATANPVAAITSTPTTTDSGGPSAGYQDASSSGGASSATTAGDSVTPPTQSASPPTTTTPTTTTPTASPRAGSPPPSPLAATATKDVGAVVGALDTLTQPVSSSLAR